MTYKIGLITGYALLAAYHFIWLVIWNRKLKAFLIVICPKCCREFWGKEPAPQHAEPANPPIGGEGNDIAG
jgi:hypothetical protein